MSDWTSEYILMIEDCEDRAENCTEWEITFLDSLKRSIAQGLRPTVKQIEVLDRIWERATKRG